MPTKKPKSPAKAGNGEQPKPAAKHGTGKQAKSTVAGSKSAKGLQVTRDQVRTELLAVWDADTWLSLWQVEQAEKSGSTLNDIGIRPIEAESYVNKYNSIIVRSSSKPALVKPSEAGSWVAKKMTWIIDEVYKRSQA